MTQNIYDDAGFFEGYSQLPRSVEGLAGAPEWPALKALLPDLAGRDVVDLGCGFGWFCRFAAEQGARRVLGLDVSENMLARARATTSAAAVSYELADMEGLALEPAAFDLAYSSLALHYIVAIDQLIGTVHRALRPGGRFVFSMEHPVYTAPSRPGWRKAEDGRAFWPLDGYLSEGPRVTDWLAEGVVKQHRTIGTMLSLLIRTGFTLEHVEEWGPTPEQIAAHPDWAVERERPPFLIVAAHR
jgi:SAM-dependent methyltransferase